MNNIINIIHKILTSIDISSEALEEEWIYRYRKRYEWYRHKIIDTVFDGIAEDYYDHRVYYIKLFDTHEQIRKQVKELYKKQRLQWAGRLYYNNYSIRRATKWK